MRLGAYAQIRGGPLHQFWVGWRYCKYDTRRNALGINEVVECLPKVLAARLGPR